MKTVATIFVMLATSLSAPAASPTWQELSSHLFTNSAIVWLAPTNQLPKSFWIYKRSLPHVFSATVISNAIVLGSLQNKGFPKPSTRDFYIPEDKPANYPGPRQTIFGIRPGDAYIYYAKPGYNTGPEKEIPDDAFIANRAWQCATQLGINPAELISKNFFTNRSNSELNMGVSNGICGRGIFLSRQLDGIGFFSSDNTGDEAEGFSIEFGSRAQIRSFSLRWSNMTRCENQPTAGVLEIINCIKAHKAIVLPNIGEEDYFSRLKKLATTRTLTVTKVTPYYGEWVFGEVPTNDVPCEFASPFAELEAVADFGNSNATLKLVSPVLSSEIKRLMKTN